MEKARRAEHVSRVTVGVGDSDVRQGKTDKERNNNEKKGKKAESNRKVAQEQ